MKRFLASLAAACVWPASAAGDVGLVVHRVAARPGEAFTVYGPCGRMPVYLAPGVSPRQTVLVRTVPRAYRLLGRLRCTGRTRYVGDYPDGDWSGWSAILRFRVPTVAPGVYRLLVFCQVCRRGPEGSLIDRTYLWRGNKRIGVAGLWVLPPN